MSVIKKLLNEETDPDQRLLNAIFRHRPCDALKAALWAFSEWHEEFSDKTPRRARIADYLGDRIEDFGCHWIQRRRFFVPKRHSGRSICRQYDGVETKTEYTPRDAA